MNAWFGPAATLTPAHYDPKHNLLAQVFGTKFVRLYTPIMGRKCLVPHEEGSLLFNTSQVDMEDPLVLAKHPQLLNLPYVDILLTPGTLLYIPPQWWHMVKSLSPSFSVSFWFEWIAPQEDPHEPRLSKLSTNQQQYSRFLLNWSDCWPHSFETWNRINKSRFQLTPQTSRTIKASLLSFIFVLH